jgi:hypothetical protein
MRMAEDAWIPKEIVDEVRSQLEPLLLESPFTDTEMYQLYLKRLHERMSRAKGISQIILDEISSGTTEPKLKTALTVLLYLTEIELLGTSYIDFVILLLTAQGIDLHLESDDKHRYTRHVTSPEDLESSSLSLHVKLDFLKSNGITFFEKCIDRELRNRIAHADFDIDEKGKFFCLTRKGKRKEVDINEKSRCYALYSGSIGTVMVEYASRVTPKFAKGT